jgi:hypothetical protein
LAYTRTYVSAMSNHPLLTTATLQGPVGGSGGGGRSAGTRSSAGAVFGSASTPPPLAGAAQSRSPAHSSTHVATPPQAS